MVSLRPGEHLVLQVTVVGVDLKEDVAIVLDGAHPPFGVRHADYPAVVLPDPGVMLPDTFAGQFGFGGHRVALDLPSLRTPVVHPSVAGVRVDQELANCKKVGIPGIAATDRICHPDESPLLVTASSSSMAMSLTAMSSPSSFTPSSIIT